MPYLKYMLPIIGASLGLAACASNARSPSDDRDRRPPIADRLFDRLDTNADNIVTFEEIEADRVATFERLDENGDGSLQAEELNDMRRAGAAQTEVYSRGRRGRIHSDRIFRMDRDRDGRISLNEFDGLQGSLLDRTDFNGDGDIDRVEFDDAIARQRSRKRR